MTSLDEIRANAVGEGFANRFWSKVDRGAEDECWPWTAATNTRGYGVVWRLGGRPAMQGAHRAALELHLGHPLTPGMEVLHSCDNPPCCNPAHLREGTRVDNVQDFVDHRTHCKNGHLLAETSYVQPSGRRRCRACVAEQRAKKTGGV